MNVLLLINGVALTLSIAILLVILLFDIRRSTNQFFALFIFFNVLWQGGFLLLQTQSIIILDKQTIRTVTQITSAGFAGTHVLLYGFLAMFLNVYPAQFLKFFLLVGVLLVLGIAVFWGASTSSGSTTLFFYLIFGTMSAYLLWRYQQRIANKGLLWGAALFILGQGMLFSNASLGLDTLGVTLAACATLIMGFALVQQDLIYPVVLRNQQLEAMHDVSLAIASRVTKDALLHEIVGRATGWIGADGALLYLSQPDSSLKIAALQHLPQTLLNQEASPNSLACLVADKKQPLLVARYYRERANNQDELAAFADTFGSVAAMPLLYDDVILGVLLVISGRQSRVFSQYDVELLSLLASQAAVAIAHDKLFNEQLLAAKQLTELDRVKSEMVRMTSHDLKNPLQAALANLDLLREDLYALKDSDIVQSVENIERQLVRMQKIISSVLDLERVKSIIKRTDLCFYEDIVASAIEEIRQAANSKEITLVYNAPAVALPPFLGDRILFERAVANLLDNAVKFTPHGGQVSLKLYEERSMLVLAISDTGIGIPQEMQSKIFERFYRGQQKGAEHSSGTGLGLSLVKTVVESHDGSVYVESSEGKGSTFYVKVPKHQAAQSSTISIGKAAHEEILDRRN